MYDILFLNLILYLKLVSSVVGSSPSTPAIWDRFPGAAHISFWSISNDANETVKWDSGAIYVMYFGGKMHENSKMMLMLEY